MLPAFKSEVRKLLTMRTTYALTLIPLVIGALAAFFANGRGAYPPDLNAGKIANDVFNYSFFPSIFMAVLAIIIMGNEYRHNTAVYTYTLTNNRSKVLASKIILVALYSFLVTLVCVTVFTLLVRAGLASKGHTLPAQDMSLGMTLLRPAIFAVGYTLLGLLFSMFFRNIIAPIVIFIVAPGPVEALAMLLLKEDAKYLPFRALSTVVTPDAFLKGIPPELADTYLNYKQGLAVFAVYLVLGWAVAWWLFVKRDAV